MKEVPLYPYAVSDALQLRLSEFDDPVTGQPVTARELGRNGNAEEDDAGLVGVSAYDVSLDQRWKKLTFKVVAELPQEELARVLPSTSDVSADTSLIIRVACPATRYRHGVRLRRTADGRWTGLATIQRDDVKGTVSLRPQLVRATGIPATESLPYATRPGAMVAVGEAVILHIDAQPKLGLSSAVQMAWEDFANSDDAWRREHPDDVYHLEPFGIEPRLWLNGRYGQLRDVLESSAKRGSEAVLRDMVAVLVAQPVTLQLCTAALASLVENEDSGSVAAPGGWRGDLIAAVLPSLYPEEPGDDERLRRAAHEFRDGDGAASLAARLGTVVQEMVASYKTVESAVRTFETVREREEAHDG